MTVAQRPVGRPGPSVQEVFARDVRPPPSPMRSESPASGLGSEDVSNERYYSKAWHDQEARAWKATSRSFRSISPASASKTGGRPPMSPRSCLATGSYRWKPS